MLIARRREVKTYMISGTSTRRFLGYLADGDTVSLPHILYLVMQLPCSALATVFCLVFAMHRRHYKLHRSFSSRGSADIIVNKTFLDFGFLWLACYGVMEMRRRNVDKELSLPMMSCLILLLTKQG